MISGIIFLFGAAMIGLGIGGYDIIEDIYNCYNYVPETKNILTIINESYFVDYSSLEN